jgi:ribosomal protein L11 methyltransferase
MIAFAVTTRERDEDALVAALWELETAGLEERARATGQVTIVAYFEDGTITLDGLRTAISGLADVAPVAIPDVDWVARFREGFRAFAAGRFWITPEWDPSPAPAGHRRLIVDPGRAFGTGTHESTALCLAALETLAAAGPLGRVLDVGTGTGILAIAAARLGAAKVAASDVDPESIDSARTHARLNDVTLTLVRADGARGFGAGRFDTVVANITAPLLIERAGELSALPGAQGRLVLAGLLDEERAAVREAYAAFPRARETRRGEWASLTLERT